MKSRAEDIMGAVLKIFRCNLQLNPSAAELFREKIRCAH